MEEKRSSFCNLKGWSKQKGRRKGGKITNRGRTRRKEMKMEGRGEQRRAEECRARKARRGDGPSSSALVLIDQKSLSTANRPAQSEGANGGGGR